METDPCSFHMWNIFFQNTFLSSLVYSNYWNQELAWDITTPYGQWGTVDNCHRMGTRMVSQVLL